jgi:lysophospholipase L1-like esterase
MIKEALLALSAVATWGASAQPVGPATPELTYRLVVHTSTGGSDLRIRLTNAYGESPLAVGQAFVGTRRSGAEAAGNRRLSFGGSASATVPAGGTLWSDPLPGTVPARSDLLVSLSITGGPATATGHGMAMQTSYLAAGDHSADAGAAAFTRQTGSWFYLDSISVRARTRAVAVLGDSITDGWQSSTDENKRWPDYLARRLAAAPGLGLSGVVNEGISGNRVLADGAGDSALKRLDRDVLSQPGLVTVILFEGVNDLKGGGGVTAADLIEGYRQIIARSHAVGVCVVGATVLPFQGWGEWTPAAEQVRQQVNAFVRTGGEFDATVDLDAALRSPYDPTRLFPPLDGGDHLHPNDKGMMAIADAVDLGELRCARPRR